ncbi:Unsaturated glucuronyl hydrolase [Botryosphaeria dothidea]|uniref:Unsaturated glucuronyl hydrolase n=1 Tax=Botryosphaeria dothidea TaxID=55169 RepID=A0A8H4ITF3_9PEZI|nr:Unsaturated glucuronyl hydrolase [Botryosphaeria dothidea]
MATGETRTLENGHKDDRTLTNKHKLRLDALYSESVIATIWTVASRALNASSPPSRFPEYTEPESGKYIYSDVDFWTSGFFPGCLYLLRERQTKYPSKFPVSPAQIHPDALQFCGKWWTAAPKLQASRTDTHDLGFMIQPWAQLGWTLDADRTCFDAMVTAARSLAARFDPRIGAIRSWDRCSTKDYEFHDTEKDFLVIIDNMINLDLLYHVSALTGDLSLAHIATTHALTTLRTHVRPDHSTAHLVVFDPASAAAKAGLTHQGHAHTSCWSRGQAWAMLGFAQCYGRVREPRFLAAALALSRYWVARMPPDGVVPWDFDAAAERGPGEPRDSSATLVAANALLLLYETLKEEGREDAEGFLDAAVKSVEGIVETCLAPLAASGKKCNGLAGEPGVDSGPGWESIVMHATISNYEHALKRSADTGLVYADYYFLLVGNKLLEMGLVQ